MMLCEVSGSNGTDTLLTKVVYYKSKRVACQKQKYKTPLRSPNLVRSQSQGSHFSIQDLAHDVVCLLHVCKESTLHLRPRLWSTGLQQLVDEHCTDVSYVRPVFAVP